MHAYNWPWQVSDLRKRVTANYWGAAVCPYLPFFETEVTHLGGSPRQGLKIVLNGWCDGCQGHTAKRSAPRPSLDSHRTAEQTGL